MRFSLAIPASALLFGLVEIACSNSPAALEEEDGSHASSTGAASGSADGDDPDPRDDEGVDGDDSDDVTLWDGSGGVGCEELALCGPDGDEPCCARTRIVGGTFSMGRGSGGDACPAGMTCPPHEAPEHPATVSPFLLDVFEVTVGRFRSFVDAYEAWMPEVGAGAHPHVGGSGYLVEYFDALPVAREQLVESLACDTEATWTETAQSNEALPINCVNWAVAFSFCIWDGGRLPTEAEWEFAAAGGDENRLFPWGSKAPEDDDASYFPGTITRAGSFPKGRGRYENSDLAGNVWEWTLDWLDTEWYAGGGATCVDCARVSSGTHRTLRGGAYSYEAVTLRAATRSGELPTTASDAIGFRCAYDEN